MPIYDYRCEAGHTAERLVRYDARDDARVCHCGLPLARVMHVPHAVPDGMYSYSPNVGSERAFEQRREVMKSGQKVIPKIQD